MIETSAKIKLKEQFWFLTKCCSCKSSQNSGNEKKPEFFLAGPWKLNLAKKWPSWYFAIEYIMLKHIKNMSNSIWLMIIQCIWQKIIHSSDVSRVIEGFDVSTHFLVLHNYYTYESGGKELARPINAFHIEKSDRYKSWIPTGLLLEPIVYVKTCSFSHIS